MNSFERFAKRRDDRAAVSAIVRDAVERAGAASPPYSNTGVTVTDSASPSHEVEFHLDYLSFSVWAGLGEVASQVSQCFLGLTWDADWETLFEARPHGARGFNRLFIGPGISIYADPASSSDSYVHVEVKGDAFKRILISDVVTLLKIFGDWGVRWHVSRLDMAWDHCPFSPAQVYRAARVGNVTTRVHRIPGWLDWHARDRGCAEDVAAYRAECERRGVEPDQGGESVYIGRRGADRRVVVYNKRGYTRLEYRAGGDFGDEILRQLIEKPVCDWSRFCIGCVLDFVSFTDLKSDSNPSRRKPLRWWREFIGDARKAGLKIDRDQPRKLLAVKRTMPRVLKRLHVMMQVFGRPFMNEQLHAVVSSQSDAVAKEIALLKHERDLLLDSDGPGLVYASVLEVPDLFGYGGSEAAAVSS